MLQENVSDPVTAMSNDMDAIPLKSIVERELSCRNLKTLELPDAGKEAVHAPPPTEADAEEPNRAT
jgi:hypothetical protein